MDNILPLIIVALFILGGILFVVRKNAKPKPTVRDYPHYVVKECNGLLLSDWLHIEFDAIGPFPEGSTITPYFQRKGDDWSAKGAMETYRWWASFATQPLHPGRYVINVPFDANWTAVLHSSHENNARRYRDALANAHRVGFTIGNLTGLGHGANPKGAIANVQIWTS